MRDAELASEAGNPHDEDASSDSDEIPPRNVESHSLLREADGSIRPPNDQATPVQVRDFIAQLLVTKRCLQIKHARRIAARWTMGNGHEMRVWPVKRYRQIFGDEDCRWVYKDVRVVVHNARKGERRTRAMCALVFTMFVLVFAGLLIRSAMVRDSDGLFIVGFVATIFGLLSCAFSALTISDVFTSAEDAVEDQLSSEFYPPQMERPKQP